MTRLTCALVAALFAGPSALAAQQPAARPSGPAASTANGLTVPAWFPAARDASPLGHLFAHPRASAPTRVLSVRPSSDQSRQQEPAIVCGMTLIPSDPKIDSRMRRPAPTDGESFVIGRVVPNDCRR